MAKKSECNHCEKDKQVNEDIIDKDVKTDVETIEQAEVQTKKSDKNPADKEIENLKIQIAESKDLLLRTAAEFDNFKKRETANRERMSNFVKGETIKALLPSLDNINLAMNADSSAPDYSKGVAMTVKGLMDALKSLGLEEINPIGQKFDVNYHMAVMKIEDESVGENIVTEVMQTGYKLGDSVLRFAMVKVANCD